MVTDWLRRAWRGWGSTVVAVLGIAALIIGSLDALGIAKFGGVPNALWNVFSPLLTFVWTLFILGRVFRLDLARAAHLPVSSRTKRMAVGGCLMIVASFAFVGLLSLVPLGMESFAAVFFLVLMFAGLAVLALVAPLFALIDAGDEEMRRYQEQHGSSAVSVGTGAGANAE